MTSWSNGPYGFPYIDYFANCLILAEGYSIQKSNNKLAKPNIGLFRSSEGISDRIPTVKLKIPGKAFLKSESRTSVTFKL